MSKTGQSSEMESRPGAGRRQEWGQNTCETEFHFEGDQNVLKSYSKKGYTAL